MKVLFVIDTLNVGGAERSIMEIASRLQGITPVVCYLYEGGQLRKSYEDLGIRVIAIGLKGRYQFIKGAGKLRKIIKKEKPDLLHSTLFRSDIICRWVARNGKIPLINSLVNNSYSAVRYAQLSVLMKTKLYCFQNLDRITARWVKQFIANSESVKQENAKALHLTASKIQVVYRGRELSDFAKAPLQETSPHEEGPILLNVSRLLQRKGQMDIIHAFPNVLLQFPSAILWIVGEGDFRKQLEAQIKLSGLTEKIKLLGSRRDVPQLLAKADVFIFPSYYEGLPGALIEAMMSRKVIVASDIPENLECVDESSAYIFKVSDINDLSAKIIESLKNKDASNQNSEKAYDQALRKFEINGVVRQYEEFYHRLKK